MRQTIATAALCLLGGHTALAAPVLNAQDLTVDLGYGAYQGIYNSSTQLNTWKGYVNRENIEQGSPPTHSAY